jgi:hypothetical protein
MTEPLIPLRACLRRCALWGAAAGVAAVAAATPVIAASLTIELTARVPQSCSASLSVSAAAPSAETHGLISTRCNTRFDLFLTYPAEIGPVVVDYDGRQATSESGMVALAVNAAPMSATSPFVFRTASASETTAAAPLTLQIAPRGF